MDPDRALVDRARSGDAEAFSELVRRHQHRLVGFLRALVSRHEEAEDVAQEVFLRAFKSLRQFRGASSFKTWLYQIASNAARTHLGKRRTEPVAPARDDVDGDPPEPRDPHDLEGALIARDRLAQALAALPIELREAVVLRDVQGFDYREIAELAGIPIGTVESRIFRGRQRLRLALSETVTLESTT